MIDFNDLNITIIAKVSMLKSPKMPVSDISSKYKLCEWLEHLCSMLEI